MRLGWRVVGFVRAVSGSSNYCGDSSNSSIVIG